MARSGSGISAIFASTALSPAARFLFARSSAFNSLARSLIAARSSAVNPSDFFAPIVPSFAGCSVSLSVRQKEVYPRPRALTSRFLIGLVTCFATHDEGLSRQPRASGTGLCRILDTNFRERAFQKLSDKSLGH